MNPLLSQKILVRIYTEDEIVDNSRTSRQSWLREEMVVVGGRRCANFFREEYATSADAGLHTSAESRPRSQCAEQSKDRAFFSDQKFGVCVAARYPDD